MSARPVAFLLLTLGLTLLLLEGALRAYNPLRSSVKHNKIILHVHNRIEVRNDTSPKLPPSSVFTTNSLGFRGPEPPAAFDRHLTMIAIGGSTTEDFYVDDDRTWPALLGRELTRHFRDVWINNAGIAGHSTVGHIVLIRDYIAQVKPKVAVFLIGLNDVDNEEDFETVEASYGFLHNARRTGWTQWLVAGALRSEVVGAAITIKRRLRASRYALPYDPAFNLPSAPHREIPDAVLRERLDVARMRLIPPYVRRIERLIALCARHQIVPVFLTQPALYGTGVDPVTGVHLETVQVGKTNGRAAWLILEMYNHALEETAARHAVTVIPLARQLPKRSDLYYDLVHHTVAGNEAIARIVSEGMREILRARFPEFATTPARSGEDGRENLDRCCRPINGGARSPP